MTPDKPVPEGWISLRELHDQLGDISMRDLRAALNLVVVRDLHWAGRRAPSGSWLDATAFPPSLVGILVDYLAGAIDIHEARRRLDDLPPRTAATLTSPDIIPDPPTPPEIMDETLTVVSSPRAWPNGQISHFGNPNLIQCARADGSRVMVRVHNSHTYTTRLPDGKPMIVHARFGGNPRMWTALGKPPRWIGRW